MVQGEIHHNKKLKDFLIKGLESKTREIKFHDSRSSITSFQASETAYDQLAEAKIQTSKQKDFIRVSPHFYNSEEDINKLLEILR